MRGTHRSRQIADIVAEARELVAGGAKELNLISQDTTYFGLDLRPNATRAIASPDRFTAATRELPEDTPTLCALLRALNGIPGDFWIRLLYTHPAHWTDELIATIAACRKVARYIDMPLQHIHGAMLERMRRETSQDYIVDLIARIRAGIPGVALRTTFIVGFPGETEAYFQTLLHFIRETRFERLGVFLYSQEEGTRAGKMAQQIIPAVKETRRAQAMQAQLQVARQVSAGFVGRTIKVLVESEATPRQLATTKIASWEHGLIRAEEGRAEPISVGSLKQTEQGEMALAPLKKRYLVARGEADAPDIDGRVYVRGRLPVGEFALVRVVGHTDYDLIADVA
jgi:ribosomal protein S12 methylthiotransferase